MPGIVELRQISDEKLEELLEDAREELFNLRFQHTLARLEDTSRLRTVRRDVARLESVLRNRELATQVAAELPEIAEAIEGHDWKASASFDYEESAWSVIFSEEGKELATTLVNLNEKKRSRKSRGG